MVELKSKGSISTLSDVDLTGLLDGYEIYYDAATGKWKVRLGVPTHDPIFTGDIQLTDGAGANPFISRTSGGGGITQHVYSGPFQSHLFRHEIIAVPPGAMAYIYFETLNSLGHGANLAAIIGTAYNNVAGSEVGTLSLQVFRGGALVTKLSIDENGHINFADLVQFPSLALSTGSGTPQLGANCPASTLTAPNTWIKVWKNTGEAVYIPAWK